MKHLINRNTENKSSIDTDQKAQALLQDHNTHWRDINILHAQLALGRELWDSIAVPPNWYKVDKQLSLQHQQQGNTVSKHKYKNWGEIQQFAKLDETCDETGQGQ